MLTSQSGFSTAFATLFQPMNNEASLGSKYPESANTLRNIASYQELMAELSEAIAPELELIDSRVCAPLKEYSDLLKKIRKTITKREHKVRDRVQGDSAMKLIRSSRSSSTMTGTTIRTRSSLRRCVAGGSWLVSLD